MVSKAKWFLCRRRMAPSRSIQNLPPAPAAVRPGYSVHSFDVTPMKTVRATMSLLCGAPAVPGEHGGGALPPLSYLIVALLDVPQQRALDSLVRPQQPAPRT